jgi:hypothetical protein
MSLFRAKPEPPQPSRRLHRLRKKRFQGCKKRQGMTSQSAEKLFLNGKKRQGTTSVVP